MRSRGIGATQDPRPKSGHPDANGSYASDLLQTNRLNQLVQGIGRIGDDCAPRSFILVKSLGPEKARKGRQSGPKQRSAIFAVARVSARGRA